MGNRIYVKDSVLRKCQNCGVEIGNENDNEILLRNISMFYMKKDTLEKQIKCRQCNAIVKIS